jgi:hypothetical protein
MAVTLRGFPRTEDWPSVRAMCETVGGAKCVAEKLGEAVAEVYVSIEFRRHWLLSDGCGGTDDYLAIETLALFIERWADE